MKMLVTATLAVVLLALGAGISAAQDFNKALAAKEAGDFETALAELLPLAEGGDPKAEFLIGQIYLNDHESPENCSKAVELHVSSAKKGYAKAQSELGWMYETGTCVEENFLEMANWYDAAIKNGDLKAEMRYANKLISWGDENSVALAIPILESAANNGNIEAQSKLGDIFFRHGLFSNGSDSLKYYKMAADQGDIESSYWTGELLEQQGDYLIAMDYYRSAAETGHVKAQFALGISNIGGNMQESNFEEALFWFRAAALQGEQSSNRYICEIFEEAKNLFSDKLEVFKSCRIALQFEAVSAAYTLGIAYDSVDGILPNKVQSYMWFSIANELGSLQAEQQLKELSRSMANGERSSAVTAAAKCLRSNYDDCNWFDWSASRSQISSDN